MTLLSHPVNNFIFFQVKNNRRDAYNETHNAALEQEGLKAPKKSKCLLPSVAILLFTADMITQSLICQQYNDMVIKQ